MSFPLKPALTLATLAALLALVHAEAPRLPGLPPGFTPRVTLTELPRLAFLTPATLPAVKINILPPQNLSAANAQTTALQQNPSSALLIDSEGSLDHFYAALAVLDHPSPQSLATVIHFGDSPTTADLITGDVRQQLQQRFGDAGPGFNLIAKPWAWYQHRDIDASDHGWRWITAVGSMKEGPYGIGGVAFDGASGASAHFRLSGPAPNSIDLAWLSQTGGGTITLTANDQPLLLVETSLGAQSQAASPSEAGSQPSAAAQPVQHFQTIPLPPETRTLDLKVTSGSVRLYGLSFNRENPGLRYDSIGLNGASITTLSRALNQEMMTASFAHLHPDLIVINYGTNEAGFAAFIDKGYELELRTAIARVRRAAPNASILLMSPMDRGERADGNAIRTMASIPRIVAIQQRVAADTGCAFFNAFASMGGDGTMQRWYEGRPRLVGGDLIHPTPQGAKIIASSFVDQLLQGYGRYQSRPQPIQPATQPVQ